MAASLWGFYESDDWSRYDRGRVSCRLGANIGFIEKIKQYV